MGKRPYFIHRNAYGFLLFGILISAFVTWMFSNYLRKVELQSLQQSFQRAEHLLYEVLDSYQHSLKGLRGAFAIANRPLRPQEFKTFAAATQNLEQVPGILSLGFARYVRDRDRYVYLKRMRETYSGFQFRSFPAEEALNKDHMFIELLLPEDAQKVALGLDMATEISRESAAIEAMITGQPTLTARLNLYRRDKSEAGLVYFLPIYSTTEVPPTASERREKIVGWTFAAMVVDILMAQLSDRLDPNLKLSIYDDGPGTDRNKLFGEAGGKTTVSDFYLSQKIMFGGRRWTIVGQRVETTQWKWMKWMPYGIFFLLTLLNVLGAMLLSKSNYLRRRAEKVARQKSAELDQKSEDVRKILDNVPCLICYWDRNLINRHCNRAYADCFMKHEDEIVGKHMKTVVGEKFFHKLAPRVWNVLEGKPQRFEEDHVAANGKYWRALAQYIPDFDGEVVKGFFAIINDITELKKSQEDREEFRNKLMVASRLASLGEMAGGVAHEINNPLAIIQLRTEVIRRRLYSKEFTVEMVDKEIDKITQTVERISKIVRSLKTLSRPGDQDPFEKVSLRQVLEDSLDLCMERYKNEDVKLEVQKFKDVEIECRPTQISQVLINLLNNAYDAVRHLDRRWVRVDITINSQISISITDSGFGIATEIADKLMQPFFTTKEVGQGTGLGLSISRRIIESHRGRLYLDTSSTHTRFVVEVPKSQTLPHPRELQ